jgi:predicted nucleic acid-binding protein
VAIFYADTSALVKLVSEVPESKALRAFLADADLVSSDLILTELPRAVRRAVADDPSLSRELLLERAGAVVQAIGLRPADRPLLTAAGALGEGALRALDAIHVASALDLHPVDAFVTYDDRQAAAARLAGMRTMAPGT